MAAILNPGIEKPGALASATGAVSRHGNQLDTDSITRTATQHQKPRALFCVAPNLGEPFTIDVSGRDRWALNRLLAAGETGCTPISEPAPRWSGYVFNLRALGVEIETITEPHGGDFPGHHARYVLRSTVTPVLERGVA